MLEWAQAQTGTGIQSSSFALQESQQRQAGQSGLHIVNHKRNDKTFAVTSVQVDCENELGKVISTETSKYFSPEWQS